MSGSWDWSRRLAGAWRALTEKDARATDAAAPPPPPDAAPADANVRAARLALDLREREAVIERLRAEFDRLRAEAEREAAGARDAALLSLARAMAGTLSQLVTMQALAEAGRELRGSDALGLGGKLERTLLEAGLARIGAPGEATVFDASRHQRMSGSDIDDGDPVTVRFVGYRLGETLLAKAMVSRRGEP